MKLYLSVLLFSIPITTGRTEYFVIIFINYWLSLRFSPFMHLILFLFYFPPLGINYLFKDSERKINLVCSFSPQMFTAARAGPDESQRSITLSRSFISEAGTQELGPLFISFPGLFSRKLNGKQSNPDFCTESSGIGCSRQQWLSLKAFKCWKIGHITGIPYNPQDKLL